MAKKKRFSKTDPFAKRESQKYENPIPSREYILSCLDHLGCAVSKKYLIETFKLTDEDQCEALRRRLRAMERDGQIISNRKGKYAIVDQLELVRGQVVSHKDGFGFLIAEDGGSDVFLAPQQMRSLFAGDRVLVRVTGTDKRGRREGVVVEILERNTQKIVGRFFKEKQLAFVSSENKNIHQDVIIPLGEENKAKHGEYVIAEIVAQPSERRQPIGRIVEIVGQHMAPGMEIEVAIRSYNLPYEWPQDVLKQAKRLPKKVEKKEIKDRIDLRKLPFVTIDGEDARDFDDAVYCEQQGKGWRLYVAIADVSHYVEHKSPLDKEAYQRGNSVYFPAQVLPMLPEELSNELCSLKPHVDRLAMVCEMVLDGKGKLSSYKFYEAVIFSHARLTYTEVAAWLVGKKKANALLPYLQNLHQLYLLLRKQRELRGALDFETTETKIVFSKNRKIKEIVPVVRNDAHKLIEECMLLANVSTAQFLLKHKLPVLYRVHKGPDAEKLTALRLFLKAFGLRLSGGDDPSPTDYAKLIARVNGRKDAYLIQTVLLRSLSQAVYTPENEGHFGLAYESYGHFTSPIRRYPDLLVHRALKHIIRKEPRKNYPYNKEAMVLIGKHCSMTERRADEATRDVVDWLKCQYMLNKVGEIYSGVVTEVTGFGVFVQLTEVYVEGLVHITSLKNDYYHFDNIQRTLTGKRTRTVYRIGDKFNVQVARVDLDERKIDFELIA